MPAKQVRTVLCAKDLGLHQEEKQTKVVVFFLWQHESEQESESLSSGIHACKAEHRNKERRMVVQQSWKIILENVLG